MTRRAPRGMRGVALMTALVLMALAATIAVAIGFSSGLTARRSIAVFSVEQGVQFAAGAEALAAAVLREDRNTSVDLPSDPWAQRVGPIEVAPEIALQAQMFDEQSRFNLNTLVDAAGRPDADAQAVFTQLLENVGVETRWVPFVTDWLDGDGQPDAQGGEDSLYLAQDPPYLAANMPVTSASELLNLPGFGIENYRKLAPYVTALPPDVAAVNLCTAAPAVLDALLALYPAGRGTRQYQDLAAEQLEADRRQATCFPGRQAFLANRAIDPAKATRFLAESSSYYRLGTTVRIGTTQFALYSLMYRDGSKTVRPILRTFGTE